MKGLKKHMAWFLVFAMLLSLIPDSMVKAQELQTTEDVVTEITTEEATAEIVTEATTEVLSEETSTEDVTESTTETATEVMDEEAEVTTEMTTEVPIEEPTTEVAPEEKEVLPEETTEEIIQKEVVTEELISEQALVDGDKRTVYNDGNWGDGYRWYIIDDDGSKHYVFCLNHGMTMTSGVYEGMITTLPYQSSFDVFRVATAIAYFDAKGDYATTQRVIWNMTPDTASKNLMAYINYAWELTEVNEERAASSASYSASLIPILKRQAFDSTVLQHWNKTRSKNYIATDTTGKGTRTFTMYGNAWKYFAKNGWIQGALVDMDGNTYRNGSVSVATNGSVTISYTATEGKGDSISTPLAAVFSIKYPYYGSNSYTMLKTPDGIQDLTYSAPKNAPGYFTFLFYTKEQVEDVEIAEVKLNKVDEYGTFVPGATFLLESRVADDEYILIDSEDYAIQIEKQGTYRLTEVATPGADYKLSNQVITFTAREVEENGVTKVMLTDSNGLYSNQASYTYTYTNEFNSGNAQIVKYGNVLVSYENGKFVYEKRLLSGVNFDFYAAEDIYANEVRIFEAGEKITTGTKWGRNHTITLSGTATNNGNLTIKDLPLGKYYALEKRSMNGFSDKQIRFNFTVKSNQTVTVNGTNGITNDQTPAAAYITKVDYDTGDKLKGAEFTLYANINNKNYDGDKLFKVSQTVPVVTERNLATGEEVVVENTWVPIKKVTTNASGKATFSNLPIGTYLVAETKAPEGYALCETTYQFTHKYVRGEEENADGYQFTHTMKDLKEKTLTILKHMEEAFVDSKGSNKDLYIYSDVAGEGAVFGIYAEEDIVNTNGDVVYSKGDLITELTTDEEGIATFTGAIFNGNYYFKELQTPDDERYQLDDTEYSFEVTNSSDGQLNESAIVNTLYKGSIKVIKTDKETKTVLEGVEFELFDADKNSLGIYITDSKGEIFIENLPVGTYYLTETKTGNAYILDGETREIDLTKEKLNQVLEIENEAYKGSIKVIKTDKDTKMVLEGVEFNLLDADKKVIGTYVTDDKGEILITGLRIGTYYLQETKTGAEYILDDTLHEIDLTSENLSQVLEITNEKYKGSIKVIKTNGDKTIYLEGVEFNLLDADKNVIGTYVTDAKGEILINDLELGTYYLQETKTLSGYQLDDIMRQIDLTTSNLDQVLEITNEYSDTSIKIKTDEELHEGGVVDTGDIPLFLVIFALLSSIICMMVLKRKELQSIISKINAKHVIFMLLFATGIVTASLSVKAAMDLKELSSEESKDVEYNGTIYEYVLTKTYESENADSEYIFEGVIDDYALADTTYEVVDTIYETEEVTTTKTYKDLAEKNEKDIPETIDKDGLTYTLSDIEWKEDVQTEDVTYTKELGYFKSEPGDYPSTHDYTYVSPVTEEETTVTLPFSHLEQSELGWHDGFSATVTFENIDGRYFTIGGRRMEYNKDSLSLTNEDFVSLVKLLGYDTSLYRFTSGYWNGGEYLNSNGVKCRDAKVVGQQYGAFYKAIYKDTVEAATTYIAEVTYTAEAVIEDSEATYIIEAKAYYEKMNVWQNIITFVKGHKTVSLFALALVVGAIAGVVVYVVQKKKNVSNNTEI